MASSSSPPTPAELRATFDAPAPLTIGIEEELLLLDPESLELAPRALDVLARTEGDPRFKPELPAAQLEIVTPPFERVADVIGFLSDARRDLAAAADGLVLPACAGAHPFSSAVGELNRGDRYDLTAAEYGDIARRQLLCSLQVHVAVGGAERSLAVYNALRAYLPEIAALAANAPYYEGHDTGLASVRPKVAELLPRQGVPPIMPSWEAFAEALRWGAVALAVPEPRRWWWELRPHPAHGTLEVRVPDSQARIVDALGVATFVHALVGWLAARADANDLGPAVPDWRIAENRWSALRDGVTGSLADLETGVRTPTRERLRALMDELSAFGDMTAARALVECNGAMRQRALGGGPRSAARWLTESFRG